MFRHWLRGSICLVFGGALLSFGLWLVVEQHRANRHTLEATGKVVSSELTTVVVRVNKNKSRTEHRAEIWYEYEVDERPYRGKRIDGLSEPTGKSGCEARVKKYPVGAFVPVFYRPDNPAEAFLERTYTFGWFTLVFVGLFLLLVSIAAFTGVSAGQGERGASPRRQVLVYGLMTALWFGAVLAAVLYFYVFLGQRLDAWRVVGLLLFLAPGVLPAYALWVSFLELTGRSARRWYY
jgi:hypothetical protein